MNSCFHRFHYCQQFVLVSDVGLKFQILSGTTIWDSKLVLKIVCIKFEGIGTSVSPPLSESSNMKNITISTISLFVD